MKHNIQFELVDLKHENAVVDLVISAYKEEKTSVPFLPNEHDCLSLINKYIQNLFKNGTGIAALCEGVLIGFLAGWEIKELPEPMYQTVLESLI